RHTRVSRDWSSDVCSSDLSEMIKLERYAQVFHLVSTVEGILRPDVGPIEAMKACFPGGSITGAPKKRAREIIAELEPRARGLYTDRKSVVHGNRRRRSRRR